MIYSEKKENREYFVVKDNALIQLTRYTYTLQQQKILLYLISKLTPSMEKFEFQRFYIGDFCNVCGLTQNGKLYEDIKNDLQFLRDKSTWLRDSTDKSETLIAWLSKVKILPNTGEVLIRFDEDLKPFLLELKKRYTMFKLEFVLALKSKYAIRLYEVLKSFEYRKECDFTLDQFSDRTGSKYNEWYDIKSRVLEPAIFEINKCTDITITYNATKSGRKFDHIYFKISQKLQSEEYNRDFEIYKRLELKTTSTKD